MPYIGRGSDFGVRTVFHFLATNGQTSVSGSDADGKALSFTDGIYIDFYLNGVRLKLQSQIQFKRQLVVRFLVQLHSHQQLHLVVLL